MTQASTDPYSVPRDRIDVSDAELFETDTLWRYLERLRNVENSRLTAPLGVRI